MSQSCPPLAGPEPRSTWRAHLPRLGPLETDRLTQGAAMSAKNDRQKLLSEVALFSACTDRELDRLARHAEVVDFTAGDVLMSEGEAGHEFFVIVDGEVGVTSGGATLAKLGAGAYVGELALLDPGPRTATVTALRDSQAVLLSSREFYAAVEDVPGLSRKLLTGMARRLREASTQGAPIT
jgi:CRP/FNR family transcriptional regulator, cyclic AMP receptor protein